MQATYEACRDDLAACGIDLAAHLRAMLPAIVRARLLAREASRAATALGKPSDVERYHLSALPDALQALLHADETRLKVACTSLTADWRGNGTR